MRERIAWSETPLVEQEPPPPRKPCPNCGSQSPPHYVDSHDQGDGSRLRHAICRRCSEPYRILIEAIPSDLETD